MNQKLINPVFWIMCLAFVLGIFLQSFFDAIYIFLFTLTLSLALAIPLLIHRTSRGFLLVIVGCFMSLGGIRHYISMPSLSPEHLIHQHNTNGTSLTLFSIVDQFQKNDTYTNYKIKVHQIDDVRSSGYAILHLKNDSTRYVQKGNSYVARLNLTPVKPIGNPYTFDYNKYLQNLKVTHSAWSTSAQLRPVVCQLNWLDQHRFKTQNHLQQRLDRANLSKDVIGFTKALVLGDKSALTKSLKTSFTDAGVIHVLAISGLHIGIIFLLLNGFFKLFQIKNKKALILQSITVVVVLWTFTWFSGASPSAIRATTMFTCFQLTQLIRRDQHPMNAVFLSVLILLIYDPNLLFSVGFQLSITAVTAIILGVPIFYNLWFPKNSFVMKFWSLVAVTLTAQLSVLPLSLYYFHQFSGVFLIANIPIMFAIPLVLVAAIIIISLSAFSFYPPVVFKIYDWCVFQIFNYIQWAADFESLILKNTYLSIISVLGLYVLLIYFFCLSKKIKIPFLWSSLILVILSGAIFYEVFQRRFKNELWILNTHKNLVLTEITSNELRNLSLTPLSVTDRTYHLLPIRYKFHYPKTELRKLKNRYTYGDLPVVILTRNSGLKNIPKEALVILHDSPKINLERLLLTCQPRQIICSKRNYPSFVRNWKATCKKLQVAFYDVNAQGSKKIVVN